MEIMKWLKLAKFIEKEIFFVLSIFLNIKKGKKIEL
jgi:hypothetical protein